jgi:hypothetical protein
MMTCIPADLKIHPHPSDVGDSMKISIVTAVMIGFASAGNASAEEQSPTATDRRIGATKSSVARPKSRSERPKIATQKLMRNPWEKPQPQGALPTTDKTGDELPYSYW